MADLATSGGAAEASWASWWQLWALASVPGLCLSVVDPGVPTAVAVAVAGAAGAGMEGAAGSAGGVSAPVRISVRTVVRNMLCAAVMAVAVVAVGSLSVAAAILYVMAMVVTTPWTVAVIARLLRRGKDQRPLSGRRPQPTVSSPAPVHVLPDLLRRPPRLMEADELCLAWRHSFVALDRCARTSDMADMVALRQAYLDEFERRDAAAFRAWLATTPRAAGGPDRHFGAARRRS